MNRDIRLSTGFWQHPKTKKTIKKLGLSGVQSLQILWLWVAVNRPSGNLSGMDWEDIELAADWQGEEKAFFDFCIGDGKSSMWIDTTPEGDFILHNWVVHNPWQAEAEERSNTSRFGILAKINKPVYDFLKKQEIKGVSKEEFEQYKGALLSELKRSLRSASSHVKAPSSKIKEPLSNTLSPTPSPLPSPQPKENKKTKHTGTSNTSHARDYTKSKTMCVHERVNTPSSEPFVESLAGVHSSLAGEPSSLATASLNASMQRSSETAMELPVATSAEFLASTPSSLASTPSSLNRSSKMPCEEDIFSWEEYQETELPHNLCSQNAKPIRTCSPSKGTPEWSNFLSCYEVYPVQKNQEGAWRAWHELSQRGVLDPTAYIRDKILELAANDSQWIAGYAPHMEKWLRNKGWNDKPHIKPDPRKSPNSLQQSTSRAEQRTTYNKQAVKGAKELLFGHTFSSKNES